MENSLEYQINTNAKKFLEISGNKEILIISHFDTDGITSATIMVQTLKSLDKKFSVKIVKSLDKKFIQSLPENKQIIFLDLASGSLEYLKESNLKNIFIIDHHEIIQEIPENIFIVNPELNGKEKLSASSLTYLFCEKLNPNSSSTKLAILGMVGDMLEKEIETLNHNILNKSEILKKRGILIYPSTRPVNRTLEFCSNPFIPGITGDTKGTLEFLRDCGINPENGKFKSLIELNDKEISQLISSLLIKIPNSNKTKIFGDIFLTKFFNKLEDARELSATINACSKFGEPETAIKFCMEIPSAKKRAEAIHRKRKQELISSLKKISELKTTNGKGFVILNAENKIKDTIIGTVVSIISNSNIYPQGTIITALANSEEDIIKISSRCVGEPPRNLREILNTIINQIGGEVGGHKNAAGALISQDKCQEFIDLFKKQMEVQVIKI